MRTTRDVFVRALCVAACALLACSSPGDNPGWVPDSDLSSTLDSGNSNDSVEPTDPGQPPDIPQLDPGLADPGGADLGQPDPGGHDPGMPDPGAVDPGQPDPGQPDPGPGDEGGSDPGQPDSGPTPVDCANIPAGPFTMTKLSGPLASEDLAFDPVGNVVGSNDKAIFKSPYSGTPQVFVPDLKFRAGMRYLPNGHLAVCDNTKGEIVRVDENGIKHTLMAGLSYPNGITVDMQGWIFFSEHDANIVWRLHPFTGEATVITTQISNPNGLTFSPDYKTLYIDGFNGNPTVYAMSISPTGTPGKLVAWANVSTGWHDGMGVDACGNVYIADYGETRIYRITPDGNDYHMIIDGSSFPNAYLPNMQWGSGVGGWDPLSIYMPDGWNKGVFEVWVGVPGKPRPYP